MIDLNAERERLLDFAARSRHPEGGFGWMNADGTADLERPRELWINTRMVYVFARAGRTELVAHGLKALREDFRDAQHGGWFARAGEPGDKRAYEHAFVLLAATAAGDQDLREEAEHVLLTHFWDERAGALVDVWNRDWTELEPYRGANANMHGVEAMLSTRDFTWLERAERVTQRFAVDNHRFLVEHFDADYQPLPDYNKDHPRHPFRPYGATPGHWFEWARLALQVGYTQAAERLFWTGVTDGWKGSGFPYTVDFDGKVVVGARLHWVLCEAIAATAALGSEEMLRHWWSVAEHFIDREGGSWHHELDEHNQPASTVWQGKPDVYHALGAIEASL